MIGDPRLPRDGLDHVVAVEVLERLEEVIRAARATCAAHIDVDDREPHQVGERRDPALGRVRVGVPVARVLDQGGVGTGQLRQLDRRPDLTP